MPTELPQPLTTPYQEKKDAWSSHAILQRWLSTFPVGSSILDVGTATGMLGKRWFGSGFYLKGIEPVQTWAEQATPYYDELLCATIEQAPSEFLKDQDVIVCADIVEHTADPEKILRQLISLQKPTTQFLISVPNVANIWVRLNLLVGKFNYTENGILDRTHLRFFTKSTFLKLLASTDLNLITLEYTPVPLNLVHPFFQQNRIGRFGHAVLAYLTRLFPGLLAYQFVARCELKTKENV